MKVLIVGAGGQGGACASILSRQAMIDEIRLMDIDEKVAEAVAAKIRSPKVITGKINATNSEEVANAAQGVDVVLDMVMPWMVPFVMAGALKAKANYINTAFDTPYWDELVLGTEIQDLPLCKEFKEAGLTALFGCGFAPGWTNILARRLANRLDRVDSIKMRVAKATIPPDQRPYDWMMRPWNPGWSPKQALIDCASPTFALEDGKFVKYGPFTGIDEYEFSAPIGKLLITHHSHEEIYSMPSTFKGVRDVDFKYFLQPQTVIFNALGLCSQQEIDVNGVKVKPIDVVSALVAKPGDGIFSATDEQLEAADKTSFVELVVEVSGIKDGQQVTWKANCPKMNAPGPALKQLYGTAQVYVALPLAIGSIQIMEPNTEKGIIFADQLDPERFIDLVMGTGYPYKWTESKL